MYSKIITVSALALALVSTEAIAQSPENVEAFWRFMPTPSSFLKPDDPTRPWETAGHVRQVSVSEKSWNFPPNIGKGKQIP